MTNIRTDGCELSLTLGKLYAPPCTLHSTARHGANTSHVQQGDDKKYNNNNNNNNNKIKIKNKNK